MTLSASPRRGMVLTAPIWADLLHVCQNLREIDWRECAAVRHDATPVSIAREIYMLWPRALVAHVVHAVDPREPVAVLLIVPTAAAQANVSLLATPRFPEIGSALTRHVLRRVRPMLIEAGIVRMECRTLEEHSVSRRWLRFLGAVEETPIPDGGKNGETFIQYAWRKSDVLR